MDCIALVIACFAGAFVGIATVALLSLLFIDKPWTGGKGCWLA
jgi:hypothetical protein